MYFFNNNAIHFITTQFINISPHMYIYVLSYLMRHARKNSKQTVDSYSIILHGSWFSFQPTLIACMIRF